MTLPQRTLRDYSTRMTRFDLLIVIQELAEQQQNILQGRATGGRLRTTGIPSGTSRRWGLTLACVCLSGTEAAEHRRVLFLHLSKVDSIF